MSTANNTALVRRFIDEVFVDGRADSVDELASETFTTHSSAGPQGSGSRTHGAGDGPRVAPPWTMSGSTSRTRLAEGDRVAVRLTSSAVQSGEFMGMPATGRRYLHRGNPHLPDRGWQGRRTLASQGDHARG